MNVMLVNTIQRPPYKVRKTCKTRLGSCITHGHKMCHFLFRSRELGGQMSRSPPPPPKKREKKKENACSYVLAIFPWARLKLKGNVIVSRVHVCNYDTHKNLCLKHIYRVAQK